VYVNFLKAIHAEVSARGRRMMFWGDIVLHYPDLIRELPKDSIALNWGYEADHPFNRETRQFARSGIPFYVCPGTSTWMSLIGRHDNALANLRRAADAGRRRGAIGYLITDWGDGGHPQPLAVSYLPYLAGASFSWCARSFDEAALIPVLSRDIFHDDSQSLARAAQRLGMAHRKLKYVEANATPLGTVIAAPLPETRELFCHTGATAHKWVSGRNIHSAQVEIASQLELIRKATPHGASGKVLRRELELAARMAAQSCQLMLWRQAVAAGETRRARALAREGIRELRRLDRNFNRLWPLRNKGSARTCSAFVQWRIDDYRREI
jgi:hypothetical protein